MRVLLSKLSAWNFFPFLSIVLFIRLSMKSSSKYSWAELILYVKFICFMSQKVFWVIFHQGRRWIRKSLQDITFSFSIFSYNHIFPITKRKFLLREISKIMQWNLLYHAWFLIHNIWKNNLLRNHLLITAIKQVLSLSIKRVLSFIFAELCLSINYRYSWFNSRCIKLSE